MGQERDMYAIGVLYESDEWSDHKLAAELQHALAARPSGADWQVRLINMEQPDCLEQALACRMLVSRIFASAQFRGHGASLERMEQLISSAESAGIPLINPGFAHRFEVNKRAATEALARVGLCTPTVYGCGWPEELASAALAFPAVIKPNCGGRTTCTAIVHNAVERDAFLSAAPAISFIAEEYIEPEYGFITRAEVVGGAVALVVRRSIAPSGLSAYHLGSTYELYDDVPASLQAEVLTAAQTLGFSFGSFDVIETARGNFFIDANSVSNVSEDCTETFGMDLMAEYAKAITEQIGGKDALDQRGL